MKNLLRNTELLYSVSIFSAISVIALAVIFFLRQEAVPADSYPLCCVYNDTHVLYIYPI